MGKHSAERRSTLPLVLATVAVVAVAVTAFLVVRVFNSSPGDQSASAAAPQSSSSGSSGSASSGPSTSSTSSAATSTPATASGTPVAGTTTAAPTTSTADTAAQTALQACVDRQSAAKALLASIATGAGHWSDHVQGQTDLDSGARTLIQVKTDTWGPTRAAGPQDVATFQAAQAAFSGAPACSTDTGATAASAGLADKLKACTAREGAMDTVIADGTKVMGDWNTHLSEMANHADGHIDSAQAQANWIKRWSESGTNLNPYKAATASFAAAPACSA